jgi:hypothetical protein
MNYKIPCELQHRGLQDISAFLEYHFYEPILYLDCDASFPSSKEKPGWWVGVANNVGDSLTFKILTKDSNKVIHRSVIRPALDDRFQNKRICFDPEPDPCEPTDDERDDTSLSYGRRRLKIDQGLSKHRKRKQLRRQLRRPQSISPDGPHTPQDVGEDLDTVARPRLLVYDVEHVDFDPDPLVSSDNRGVNTLVNGEELSTKREDNESTNRGDHALTDKGGTLPTNRGDDLPKPPSLQRSDRLKEPLNQKSFRIDIFLPYLPLLGGFLLGLSMHSTYPTFSPTSIQLEGKLPSLNPHPKQFSLGTLNERKTDRLRDLQHLNTLKGP